MLELSKASEAKLYFEDIIRRNAGIKIKSIFSEPPGFSNNLGFRKYFDDMPIYIQFENDFCLVIDYQFIDALNVEYRPLSEEEKDQFADLWVKDYFNCTVDIHSYTRDENGDFLDRVKDRTMTISLEYDMLTSVEIRRVTEGYSKWIDGDLECAVPTEETFDEIKFIMKNGNTFIVCADDAMVDGDVMAWSSEAKESIIKYC